MEEHLQDLTNASVSVSCSHIHLAYWQSEALNSGASELDLCGSGSTNTEQCRYDMEVCLPRTTAASPFTRRLSPSMLVPSGKQKWKMHVTHCGVSYPLSTGMGRRRGEGKGRGGCLDRTTPHWPGTRTQHVVFVECRSLLHHHKVRSEYVITSQGPSILRHAATIDLGRHFNPLVNLE